MLALADGIDGVIVVDVRTDAHDFLFSRCDETNRFLRDVGISFDSSKIPALCVRHTLVSEGRDLCVWDLPSGALLHNLNVLFAWLLSSNAFTKGETSVGDDRLRLKVPGLSYRVTLVQGLLVSCHSSPREVSSGFSEPPRSGQR